MAANVSLPDGTMKPVDVLALLPPEMRALYSTLDGVIDPVKFSSAKKKRPRKWKHSDDKEYWALLARMQKAGMITYLKHPPLVINNFFLVTKPDGSLRLIIDCRPANNICVDPLHTNLPTPSDFGRIPPEFSWMSKSDLSDFYHTILLPAELIPLFGLPPVRACDVFPTDVFSAIDTTGQKGSSATPTQEETLLFPCCSTLAMGWSHSVSIAQTAHKSLLERDGGIPNGKVFDLSSLDPAVPLSKEDVIRTIYIDDVLNAGCSERTSNAALQAASDAYVKAGFRLKDKKRCAAAQQMTALGVEFDGINHQFRVAPEKVQALITKTIAVIFDKNPVEVDTVRSLVGSWLWVCLVRRPSLSVLAKTFAFTTKFQHGRARLWPTCRRELAALCALAPALIGSMSRHENLVMATDASTPGYGVTYCHAERVDHLLHYADRKGSYVRLQRPMPEWQEIPLAPGDSARDPPALRVWVLGQTWLVAMSNQFRVRSHINRQEIIATILALRWLGQQDKYWGTRVFILCDSTVAVGALAKGRSSARALTSLLRRYAGLSLCFGIEISLIWVSTDINPADGPSRGCGVQLPNL